MSSDLYVGAAALEGYSEWQDAIASNIASSTIPGQRQNVVGLERAASSEFANLMVPKVTVGKDFSAGDIMRTGNATHMAIEGEDGFFSFEGGTVLSRDGEFHWDAENYLVNKYNQKVDGDSGPISRDSGNGPVMIDRAGNVTQAGQNINKIAIYGVDNKKGLEVTHGGFASTEESKAATRLTDVGVVPESLEKANRSSVKDMVALTKTTTAAESIQAVIKMADSRRAYAIQHLKM